MSSLSSDERTVVQTLLELNFSIRGIARFLNRSPATISVEIRQVTSYNAKQAHQLALALFVKHIIINKIRSNNYQLMLVMSINGRYD